MVYNKLFEYRDGYLYNKFDRGPARKGDLAGGPRQDGYWRVSVSNKQIRLHRVIWEMHNGPIPDGLVIDHIDRDISNNRIENLRAVTIKQNSHNCNQRGIWYSKKNNRWRARITVDGNEIHLGWHKTEKEARQAYVDGKEKYHGVIL